MRRYVLPASLTLAIVMTAGALAAFRPPERLVDPSGFAGVSTVPHAAGVPRDAIAPASPVDADGWQALGRAESIRGHHAEAVVAFRNATALRPNDANLLSEYAFSAAVTSVRTEADDPQRLVRRALQIEPNNVQALTLSGSLALDRGDYEAAAQDWERLARLEPADSPMRREVEASAAQARHLAGHARVAPARVAGDEAGRFTLARAELAR